MIGKHCVIRTYSAGVHIGEVISKNDKNIVLKNARRLWKWSGAFTLSEVAIKGINVVGSRMSIEVPEIELTEVIEIIPTSEAARKTFELINE